MKLRPPALLFSLLLLSGCAGPELSSAIQIAQYGTSTFTQRGMESVCTQPFDKVVDAVRTMVSELDLKVAVDKPQDGFLYIEAHDQQGTTILIRIRLRTRSITSLRVKVGFFNDEPYATAIMTRVLDTLKRPAAPITP